MRKEEFRSALQMERKKVECAAYIMLGPRVNTWSAIMPAYCYTELCPDPGYHINILSVPDDRRQ